MGYISEKISRNKKAKITLLLISTILSFYYLNNRDVSNREALIGQYSYSKNSSGRLDLFNDGTYKVIHYPNIENEQHTGTWNFVKSSGEYMISLEDFPRYDYSRRIIKLGENVLILRNSFGHIVIDIDSDSGMNFKKI